MQKKLPPGISMRHARSCAVKPCRCTPTYQAQVGRGAARKTKTFPTMAAARNWRQDVAVARRQGVVQLGACPTFREAAEKWLAGAQGGSILTRSREPYKPSSLRGYREALELRIYDRFGAAKLDEIRLVHLQDLVEDLVDQGADASTIRNTLMPVRVIYRRAISRGQVLVNPTRGLELPAVTGRRERFATAAEAAALIVPLPVEDQALWATAFYAGLRRGELMALDWQRDVDLDASRLRVRFGWDVVDGEISTKSNAGARTLPIVTQLGWYLRKHQQVTGRKQGLVFGRTSEVPFAPPVPGRRAARVWAAANAKAIAAAEEAGRELGAGELLNPVTLHECRHTFASLMIAAQANAGKFNPKVLQELMGHSSITVTYDRYGHLFPGSQDEAGQLLELYLKEASSS